MKDLTIKHPAYEEFEPSWRLMRDSIDGEDQIKSEGEKYLPMKTGTAVISDHAARSRVYDLYKTRAEFPEIVAPTIRGAVGIATKKSLKIDLPAALEPLRERATLDGLTLESLYRRMVSEIMAVGRYGLLPSLTSRGEPYLAGYVAESIINWDSTEGIPDYVVLNESGLVRNRENGEWEEIERYRECESFDGVYRSLLWEQTTSGAVLVEENEARTRDRRALPFLPFVFVGSLDLTPEPDDVPLYGLAKLAVRIYRMDADYSFSLHMTSEPTPVAIGFDDAASAIERGEAPKTLGSSVIWLMPKGGDAKYLEFSGQGIEKQASAINDSFARAAQQGAQIIQQGQSQESGEALKLRAASQTATLDTIVRTASAGLEKALRNLAIWVGADPDEVVVTADTDFFDHNLNAQEITAIVAAWQAGAISYKTMFDKLQQGGIIHEDTVVDDEQAALFDNEDLIGGIIANNPCAEGATE